MGASVIDRDGERELVIDRASVAALQSESGFFWIDLVRPTQEDVGLLGDAFGFHPIAIEDAVQFRKRPRLDSYADHLFLIGYAARGAHLVEAHAFFSQRFLITIRHGDSDAFTELRKRMTAHQYDLEKPLSILYHLIDAMIETFFPVLGSIDERIDAIGDEIMQGPTDKQLHEVFELKRRLVGLRRVIVPQRDYMNARDVAAAIPGMTDESERYFRDLYDRLVRLGEAIDSYRDLLTSTLDVYLSTVSNRLNVVITKLTVLATIFLPITFITGFFGQNFGWLADRVGGLGAFLGLGIGLELAATGALLLFMWRRRWF